MTISSQVRKAGPFVGNGSATVFPFAFKVFTAADVYVVRTHEDADTVLVLNTDYTVVLNADQNANPGGSVTLPAVLATDYSLTITSTLAYLQPTDLTNQGGFYPSVITNALDRLTIFCQQLADAVSRSLKLSVSVPAGVNTTLPPPSAFNLLGWNDDEDGIKNVSPGDIAFGVTFATATADLFSGNGATTVFTLSGNPGSINSLDVSISGVTKRPVLDYLWVSGSTLTFTSAPAAGTNNILVRYSQGLPSGYTSADAVSFESTNVDAALKERPRTVATHAALLTTAGVIGQQVLRLDYSAGFGARSLKFKCVASSGLTSDGGWIAVNGAIAWVCTEADRFLEDFGCDFTGATASDTQFNAAKASCKNDEVLWSRSGATYRFNAKKSIGGVNECARIRCNGFCTFKFYGLGASDDCFTMNGAAFREMDLIGVVIDCNGTGRDGLVLADSDHAKIAAKVRSSIRDSFVLFPGASGWIENATLDLELTDCGRHATRQEMIGGGGGFGGAFINEILWERLEIRGVSRVTAGGQAMLLTSTATGGASKFANQYFLKSNFDAIYNTGNPAPSTNVIECDSGIVESFKFSVGAWENTGSGSVAGGYAIAVTGTGYWGGLFVDSLTFNSNWGQAGVSPGILKQTVFDYSFDRVRLSGTVQAPTNCHWYVTKTTTQANQTGDGTVFSYLDNGVTEINDGNGNILSNGIITAPVDGLYRFDLRCQLSGVGAGHTVGHLILDIPSGTYSGLYFVSPTFNPAAANDAGGAFLTGSITLYLNAGNTAIAKVQVKNSTKTVGVDAGVGSTFSGCLIG